MCEICLFKNVPFAKCTFYHMCLLPNVPFFICAFYQMCLLLKFLKMCLLVAWARKVLPRTSTDVQVIDESKNQQVVLILHQRQHIVRGYPRQDQVEESQLGRVVCAFVSALASRGGRAGDVARELTNASNGADANTSQP